MIRGILRRPSQKDRQGKRGSPVFALVLCRHPEPSRILNGGSRHNHGGSDLPEEHAGGGPRRGDQSEQAFGMKMIGVVCVSLMISY